MDIWDVRAFVYQHFADKAHAPSVDQAARHFNISSEEAGEIYRELNNRHAFFLEPGTLTIRMANPFSNLPTDFKVHANGKIYFANCAWDMLGIPAALGCDAADARSQCAGIRTVGARREHSALGPPAIRLPRRHWTNAFMAQPGDCDVWRICGARMHVCGGIAVTS